MRHSEFEQLKPQDKICSLYSGNVYAVKSLDLKAGDIYLPNNGVMRYQDCKNEDGFPYFRISAQQQCVSGKGIGQ